MRPIKFRVLFTVEGVVCSWYYDSLQAITNELPGHDIDWESAQQYTGLKDSTGLEIYEGDIITIDVSQISHLKEVNEYVVVWNDDTALGYGWGAWELTGKGFMHLDGFGIYKVVGEHHE